MGVTELEILERGDAGRRCTMNMAISKSPLVPLSQNNIRSLMDINFWPGLSGLMFETSVLP